MTFVLQLEQVQAFADQADKLGTAEHFFLLLAALPDVRMRVDGMLLKCELREKYDSLLPDIDAILTSARAIEQNHALALFLRYSLHTGNFINAVSHSVTPRDVMHGFMQNEAPLFCSVLMQ